MGRLSIIVPTHDRAASLRRTLSSVLAQTSAPTDVELLVVDNNSSDATPEVCRDFAPRVRYIFEPKQGLSFARNAGIEALRPLRGDDLVAFIDDDIEAAPGWIAAMVRAFETHPEVDCVGGRVLPEEPRHLPAWLTPEHWAPLALQDHGPAPRIFDERTPLGLVGANVAFRGPVFDRIGGFSPDVQRVRDGIGSTEDHEFLRRLYAAGGRALYAPDVIVTTDVPAERLTPAYHRRWHRGHGRFHALMRTPEMEHARARLLGIPLHLFRSAAADMINWLRLRLSGDRTHAFAAENRLWFFSGFFKERCGCLTRR